MGIFYDKSSNFIRLNRLLGEKHLKHVHIAYNHLKMNKDTCDPDFTISSKHKTENQIFPVPTFLAQTCSMCMNFHETRNNFQAILYGYFKRQALE